MNGLLVIDKPAGMTSHDVVNAVRRLAGTRRVGHAGTLDPLATGVLLVLVGRATRLSRYLSGADKVYEATVRLGETTTTYDAEGEIVERQPVKVTRAEVEAALLAFRGPIQQLPPMYSAIKVQGQKLYQLARQGQEIAREPRPVTIKALALTAWTPPTFTLRVHCSAGTYIRSLAHDLGQVLGCGAHLTALNRLASGPFTLEQGHTLEALRALAEVERLGEVLLAPQAALYMLPAVHVNAVQALALCHGQPVALEDAPQVEELQALDADGELVAVLAPIAEGLWRPTLVLQREKYVG